MNTNSNQNKIVLWPVRAKTETTLNSARPKREAQGVQLQSMNFEQLLEELRDEVWFNFVSGTSCQAWLLRLRAVEGELSNRELSAEQTEAVKEVYGSIPKWKEEYWKSHDGWLERYRLDCENGQPDALIRLFHEVKEMPDPVWLKTMEEVLERRFPALGLTLGDVKNASERQRPESEVGSVLPPEGFTRLDAKDEVEIQSASFEELLGWWKERVYGAQVYGCFSIRDLDFKDRLELEFTRRHLTPKQRKQIQDYRAAIPQMRAELTLLLQGKGILKHLLRLKLAATRLLSGGVRARRASHPSPSPTSVGAV